MEKSRAFIRKKFPIFTISSEGYQRYKFVSNLLVREECFSILDVGGGKEGFFQRFLPDRKSLTLDPEGGDVVGDGRHLPFGKDTFDAVTALETMEYIEKKDRKKFIEGMVKVAKKCVILTFPIENEDIRSAEIRCNNFYRMLFGEENRWLKIHIKDGLPTKKEVESLLKGKKAEIYPICNLKKWEKMLKLNLLLLRLRLNILIPIADTIFIAFNGLGREEPTYSNVFLIKKV